jgi:hypothetical protein
VVVSVGTAFLFVNSQNVEYQDVFQSVRSSLKVVPHESKMHTPSTKNNIRTSSRDSKIKFRQVELLRWSELLLRGIVVLACIAALVIPIIVTITIKHQLSVSYAAVGLVLSNFLSTSF